MKFKATYEFEAASPEAAAQKVFTSFYLADIDAEKVKVEQVGGGEVFSYPLTQRLIRHLNEGPNQVTAGEGDWQIASDAENKIGEDTN